MKTFVANKYQVLYPQHLFMDMDEFCSPLIITLPMDSNVKSESLAVNCIELLLGQRDTEQGGLKSFCNKIV